MAAGAAESKRILAHRKGSMAGCLRRAVLRLDRCGGRRRSRACIEHLSLGRSISRLRSSPSSRPQSGIHVNYSVLDSPEMAETILSAGSSNYDLVTMNASPELGREIPKGFWKVLDWARIPNARNADPKIMQMLSAVDPRQSARRAVDVGHHRADLRPRPHQSHHAERASGQPRHDPEEELAAKFAALRDRSDRLLGRHPAHGGPLPRTARAVR